MIKFVDDKLVLPASKDDWPPVQEAALLIQEQWPQPHLTEFCEAILLYGKGASEGHLITGLYHIADLQGGAARGAAFRQHIWFVSLDDDSMWVLRSHSENQGRVELADRRWVNWAPFDPDVWR